MIKLESSFTARPTLIDGQPVKSTSRRITRNLLKNLKRRAGKCACLAAWGLKERALAESLPITRRCTIQANGTCVTSAIIQALIH